MIGLKEISVVNREDRIEVFIYVDQMCYTASFVKDIDKEGVAIVLTHLVDIIKNKPFKYGPKHP